LKRFRFRFEAVLKHRVAIEDQRLQEFSRVQGELTLCDNRLSMLHSTYYRGIAERPAQIDVEDFPRRERYLDTLRARIDQEERIREGVAARLDDARQALIAARQAREALERVRAEDMETHKREAAKAEQDALDEISTQRYQRGQMELERR
jgi:flagellar export protein FliJ